MRKIGKLQIYFADRRILLPMIHGCRLHTLVMFFALVFFSCSLVSCVGNNDPEIITRTVVAREDGYFMGWPANNGVWTWDDGEIVVGFTRGPFLITDESMHFIDPPYESWLARSKDGGYTWESFNPEGFVSAYDPDGIKGDSLLNLQELTKPLNLQDNNFMLRVTGNGYLQPDIPEAGFYYSYDRGETWEGPFAFKGLSEANEFEGMGAFTPRTDYIIESNSSALFFLSVRTPEGSDKSFTARTNDGGLSFKFSGWLVDPDDPFRAVMPSTVQTSSGKLVSAIRRREVKRRDLYPHCWIDIYVSEDKGENWDFLSRAAETGVSNGNPPALIQLSDGRLLLAYGNREHYQIRARFSSDEGKLWGPEIILREGVQVDFGYPRLVQNSEGDIITFYYWADLPTTEKYIEAAIWDPGDNDDKWGGPVSIASKQK